MLKQLGWHNEWWQGKTPENAAKVALIEKCRKLGHKPSDRDQGRPPMRGLDHVVTCEICGYQYHYDSSD